MTSFPNRFKTLHRDIAVAVLNQFGSRFRSKTTGRGKVPNTEFYSARDIQRMLTVEKHRYQSKRKYYELKTEER